MKLFDIIKTANSNLLRNKGRTFLTILAIFIGSFTIIATSAIQTGVNGYIDGQVAAAGGKNYFDVMKGTDASMVSTGGMSFSSEVAEYNPDKDSVMAQIINKDDIAKIKEIPGVERVTVTPPINFEYITASTTDKKYVASMMPFVTDTFNLELGAGRTVDNKSATPEITILDKFVEPLGFKSNEDAIGKTVTIAVANEASQDVKTMTATVVGVQNSGVISMGRNPVNDATMNELSALAMEGMPESVRESYFWAGVELEWNEPTDTQIMEIKDALKKINMTGMTVDDQAGMIKSFFDAILLVFTIFGGIALLAASIGIINTLFMSVQERTREIGLMKAMGLGKGKIFFMFSIEAISIGFWGSAIGVGVAYLAKSILNPIAADTFLKDLPGFNLMEFDVLTLVYLVLLVMAIAFLAGTLPARRAAKKDPIEALRYE